MRSLLAMMVITLVFLPAAAWAEVPGDGGGRSLHGECEELGTFCLYSPLFELGLIQLPQAASDSSLADRVLAGQERPEERPSFLHRALRVAGGLAVPAILAGVIIAANAR